MKTKFNVYVLNLPYRVDRKESIQNQFAGKEEFNVEICRALSSPNGPWSLWQNFYNIVKKEAEENSEYFIFVEDDHVFTSAYELSFLQKCISEAESLDADLLSGGMAVVKNPVLVTPHLFWVRSFNGMQFTIIFKRLYSRILSAKTSEGYVTDIHLSFLAKRKFVMFPYISVQKDFGYSDATSINNVEGRVMHFFDKSQSLLQKIYKVNSFYKKTPTSVLEEINKTEVQNFYIPAYLINLKSRNDRKTHSINEFSKHKEFRLSIVEACEHECGAVGLWNTICKIVKHAKEMQEDFVLICEDDHCFTADYQSDVFLRQVMLASALGAQILNGGIGGFANLVRVSDHLYWVDWFWCTQFIVVYKNAYDKILNAEFTIRDVADDKLSKILTNKMAIVPLISEQADFGYSDVTSSNNHNAMIRRHFDKCKVQLKHYEFCEKMMKDSPLSCDESGVCIERYLQMQQVHALHLGCGQNLINGWLNTDLEPTYGATFLDATQMTLLPNGCMDYIFAEHLFESFRIDTLFHVFMECARILKKDGILRFVVYTNEKIIKEKFSKEKSCTYTSYSTWNLLNYDDGWEGASLADDGFIPYSVVLHNFMKNFTNAYIYDWGTLKTLLHKAGFLHLRQCECHKSKESYLKNRERHKSYKPDYVYVYETIVVEAQKL